MIIKKSILLYNIKITNELFGTSKSNNATSLDSYSDDKILRIILKGKFKARFLIKVNITEISFRKG